MAVAGLTLNKEQMNRILKGWDIVRIVRLLLGVAATIYSISSKEYVFLMVGGLLLFQAAMNISCCGAGGCSTDSQQKKGIYSNQIKKYEPSKK